MVLRPTFAFALLLATLAAGCADPSTRSVPVGRMHRAFVDSTRPAWEGEGARPLAATVWYPAAPGSVESNWSIGVFEFGRSAVDAAIAPSEPRPLVVLSHGTGGSAAQMSWLAESLAAAGFVVAAVNHHGNTAAEDRPAPHGFVLPWERARDVSTLIDRLLADPAIGPRIARERIGVAGFSLGGYTALASAGARLTFDDWQRYCASHATQPGCTLPPEATFTRADVDALARSDAKFQASVARATEHHADPRIRAVFAIAPALLPMVQPASLQAVQVPVRIVLGEADTQVPAASNARYLARHMPRAVVTRLPGVGHYAFLAPCTLRGRLVAREVCSDGNGIDRRELHARTGEDATRFFRMHLAEAAR